MNSSDMMSIIIENSTSRPRPHDGDVSRKGLAPLGRHHVSQRRAAARASNMGRRMLPSTWKSSPAR